MSGIPGYTPRRCERISSDEVSISFSRTFAKATALECEQSLPMLKSALEIHGFSCQLNMSVYSNSWSLDNPPNADMTFLTSKTNSEDNVARARTALDYLQLRVPIPVVIKVMNGTFSESFMLGYQKGGLCSKFNIQGRQFYERTRLLDGCLQELEQRTGCHIYNVAKRVIIVGSLQGAKVARKIVLDCIVHNVPPTPRIRDIMRINVATQKLGTFRL